MNKGELSDSFWDDILLSLPMSVRENIRLALMDVNSDTSLFKEVVCSTFLKYMERYNLFRKKDQKVYEEKLVRKSADWSF